MPLTLVPVLALKLQFPSEGRVAINDEEPVTVQDGQFLRELSLGTYSVKFIYRPQQHRRFYIRSPAGWAGRDHRAAQLCKVSPLCLSATLATRPGSTPAPLRWTSI